MLKTYMYFKGRAGLSVHISLEYVFHLDITYITRVSLGLFSLTMLN